MTYREDQWDVPSCNCSRHRWFRIITERNVPRSQAILMIESLHHYLKQRGWEELTRTGAVH